MNKFERFQLVLGAMVFGGLALTYIGVAVVEGDGGAPGYIEVFAGAWDSSWQLSWRTGCGDTLRKRGDIDDKG